MGNNICGRHTPWPLCHEVLWGNTSEFPFNSHLNFLHSSNLPRPLFLKKKKKKNSVWVKNRGEGNSEKRRGSERQIHGLNVFYTNSRTIINKVDTLMGIASAEDLDIIGITNVVR